MGTGREVAPAEPAEGPEVSRGPYVPGQHKNLRGPRRSLTLDEQLELVRLMREAKAERRAYRTARGLAARYGVSARTVWRYIHLDPTPPGMELLRRRIVEWSEERDIGLTTDDLVSLLFVISRHRNREQAA